MKYKEDIHSVTYLKSRAADLLEQINETRRPVVITQKGEARGVLVDPVSYEQFRFTVGLLKILAQSEEEIQAGSLIEQEKLFRSIKRKLIKRKNAGVP